VENKGYSGKTAINFVIIVNCDERNQLNYSVVCNVKILIDRWMSVIVISSNRNLVLAHCVFDLKRPPKHTKHFNE